MLSQLQPPRNTVTPRPRSSAFTKNPSPECGGERFGAHSMWALLVSAEEVGGAVPQSPTHEVYFESL